jgi:hypothetical protein
MNSDDLQYTYFLYAFFADLNPSITSMFIYLFKIQIFCCNIKKDAILYVILLVGN